MRQVLIFLILALPVATATRICAQQGKVEPEGPEYDVLQNALQQKGAARGAALEAYVAQYPQSKVRTQVLEEAMTAYGEAGDLRKALVLAERVLTEDPSNIAALGVVTLHDKRYAKTENDFKKLRAEAERGLASMAALETVDFEAEYLFAEAAGYAAMEMKDYAAARKNYLLAIAVQDFAVQPDDSKTYFNLGRTYLDPRPLDTRGFWYMAKAYHIAKAANRTIDAGLFDIAGSNYYREYHGSTEGWTAFRDGVATQEAPPAEIAVTAAPKP